MPLKLCAIPRAHIQMMVSQMFLSIIFECFPSCNTQISFVTVTDFSKRAYHFLQILSVPDNNIDVYDRFCRQPPHGCTAHMLDPHCQRPKHFFYFIPYLYKIIRPCRIIRHNYNSLISHLYLLPTRLFLSSSKQAFSFFFSRSAPL